MLFARTPLKYSDTLTHHIVSGVATNVVFDFTLEHLQLSYSFSIEPKSPNFNEITTRRITCIRIYITDGFLRPADLNGIPVSIKLIKHSVIRDKLR